jgi:hypothetical protein
MEKIKLLHIVPKTRGGIREYIISLLGKLSETGRFELHVLSHRDEYFARRLSEMNVNQLHYDDKGSAAKTALALFFAALKAVKETGANVVHSHGYKAGLVSGVAAALRRKPHILTIHTLLGRGGNPLKKTLKSVYQALLPFFSLSIIFVCDAARSGFFSIGAHRKKLALVYGGLDFEKYATPAGPPDDIKKFVTEGDIVIGCVARALAGKGCRRAAVRDAGNIERIPERKTVGCR